MRKPCKRLYELTKKLFNFFVSLFSVLLFSSFKCNRTINKVKKNKCHNKCIVMGNGPSLPALLDFYKDIEDRDLFAVNFYCLTELYNIYKPTHYIVLDPGIFNGRLSELVKQSIDAFNTTDWYMNLFVPYNYRDSYLVKSINNENIHLVFYNYTPIDVCPKIDFYFFKHNLGMPCPENIIIAAIFEAINLGYNTIHLFGVEQSWLKFLQVDDNNIVTIGLQHYTSNVTGKADYLHSFLLSQARSFRSNVRLAEYARALGVDVINNTPDSYLDAYRKEISEILQCK